MSRPQVFVTRRLPAPALAIVEGACDCRVWEYEEEPCPPEVLAREMARAEGILTMATDRIDPAWIAAAPRLRVIANMAVGYDNIPLQAATEHGVLVTNTPGVLDETTADLAFALMLAAARRLYERASGPSWRAGGRAGTRAFSPATTSTAPPWGSSVPGGSAGR